MVMVVAGSDSGGGAGVQADLAALRDHGVFGCTAITAITAQHTRGVESVFPLPPGVVADQIRAVASDIRVDVVKIGMLGNAALVVAVDEALRRHLPDVPIVLDPVMISTSGHRLLDADAVSALRDRLGARAAVCTPNLPEASAWVGSADEGALAAWAEARRVALVVTGGDADGAEVVDRLFRPGTQPRRWSAPRIAGGPFHGTGCTFASALAARMALGQGLEAAVEGAIAYVRSRLLSPLRPGGGAAVGGFLPARG